MQFPRIFLPALLIASAGLVHAQKAWVGHIDDLLGKVPVPGSSGNNYAACTKSTEASTGIISVRDNGPQFTQLEAQLDAIMKGAIAGAQAPAGGVAPPSADQIEQMKQQAMARAAAAQSMTPQQMAQQRAASSALSLEDTAVMRLINQAQLAAGHIGQLSQELDQKYSRLNKSLDSVKLGPVCPEVEQHGYAGPTCACLRGRESDYRTRRVAAMNSYVGQVAELFRQYMPRIKAEAQIIDDMEVKAKYGDAVSNPAYRQMAVNIQRQGLSGVSAMMSLSGGAWKDSAEEYAKLVNAKSGASVPCTNQ